MLWRRGLLSDIVSTCHREDWTLDWILPGYNVVALKKSYFIAKKRHFKTTSFKTFKLKIISKTIPFFQCPDCCGPQVAATTRLCSFWSTTTSRWTSATSTAPPLSSGHAGWNLKSKFLHVFVLSHEFNMQYAVMHAW
jgi:hypothetical protein